MRADGLSTIKGLRPPVVPPRDPKTGQRAKVVGVTEDGDTIYVSHLPDHGRRREARAEKNENGDPKYQRVGPDGELVFRKDVNGEVYPVIDVPPFWKEEKFILVSSPRGHVRKRPFREPSEAEKAEAQAREYADQFLDRVKERAIQQGVTPEELVDRLLGGDGAPAAVEAVPEAEDDDDFQSLPSGTEFPHHKGGGNWYLSDGSSFRGKKEDAIAAEAQLLATVEF